MEKPDGIRPGSKATLPWPTASVALRSRFRQDMRAAQERLERLAAWTASPGGQIETPAGEMRVAVRGEGYPVLISHGAMGGFDRALDFGEQHLGAGYQVLAPSRYGYPGSPIPRAATPASQAMAFVSLLDHLEIDSAAVIAHSTGSIAAVQMALRYPDRVTALILIAGTITEKKARRPLRPLLRAVLGSDFLFWLLMNPLRGAGRGLFVQHDYAPGRHEAGELADVLLSFLPMGPRREGVLFDLYVTNPDPLRYPDGYRMEELDVPVLFINARDDPLIDYAQVHAMHNRVLDAHFVTVPSGGHFMLGHGGVLRAEIDAFIEAHA
jgi:pimeloyl-ACP methyl ester carboxylesterase